MVTTLCDLAGCGQQRVEQAALLVLCGYAARRPDDVSVPRVLLILQAMDAAMHNARQRGEEVGVATGVGCALDVSLHVRLAGVLRECLHAADTQHRAYTAWDAVCMATQQLLQHLASLLPFSHSDHTNTSLIVDVLSCMQTTSLTLPCVSGDIAHGITQALAWWLHEGGNVAHGTTAHVMQPQVVSALLGTLQSAAASLPGGTRGNGGTVGRMGQIHGGTVDHQGDDEGKGATGGRHKRRRVTPEVDHAVGGIEQGNRIVVELLVCVSCFVLQLCGYCSRCKL